MENNEELEALENAVKSCNIEGLRVLEAWQLDKRKTVKKYYLQLGVSTFSPKLDYMNLTHFILGMIKMKGLNKAF